MFTVINPATGQQIAQYPMLSNEALDQEITYAAEAFPSWASLPLAQRLETLHRIANVFDARRDELVETMAREMGKRPSEGQGEIDIVVSIFRYYADNAERLLADEELDIVGGKATIRRKPTGVIFGIMPWNYPIYQVGRFVAPNLALGNTMLLKHAPSCPESALAIVSVLQEAGVPEGVYRNVFIDIDQIEQVVAHPAVAGVSLTGSERAGRAVAELAGRHLKKVVLELGGSDPMLILDTDNIQQTANQIVQSRLSNSGQACNSPKRVIVLDDVYDQLVEAVVAEVQKQKVGDPFDSTTTVAPLSSRAAAQGVLAQINQAVAEGAVLHTGGTLLDDTTAMLYPAVLTDVEAGTAAYSEEIFGPVVMLFRVKSVEDAIVLANDTDYGLGSSVFSRDRARALEVGQQIEAGMLYVNQAGGSQADLPFGGTKRSGIGRELGPLGIDEFANKMTIRH